METKECSRCHLVKPIGEFHHSKGRKDGHVCHCKTCRAEYKKKYDDNNRETKRAKSREYYKKNKEKIQAFCHTPEYRAKERVWKKAYLKRPDVKEKSRKRGIAFRQKVLQEAFAFFGPCACCGESNPMFLSLDHINGNGSEERRNGLYTITILEKLRREGWPEDAKKMYRFLCYNCNFTIGHYGYCPHHPDIKYPYYNPTHKKVI
jgi:hypothetical protein